MIFSPKLVAVLDACVLYSAPLRDLLLQLAYIKLYQPKWSNEIENEWRRNLQKNRPELQGRLDNVILQMKKSFPQADVMDYESLIPSLTLPDANDRHVLAAAIHCEADLIVTFNLKDFPVSRVRKYGIDVLHPDIFVLNVIESDPDLAFGAFKHQVASLKNPPFSEEEILRFIHRSGLVKSAARLKKML